MKFEKQIFVELIHFWGRLDDFVFWGARGPFFAQIF